MKKITVTVTERELLERESEPYYRLNQVSALADLIEEKAGVTRFIGFNNGSFIESMNRIMEELGADSYCGRIDNDTMSRVYTFIFKDDPHET